MSKETLGEGRKLQAGNFFSTRQVSLAADTYHVGMLLEQTAGVYAALSTGTIAGIYNGTGGRVLSAQGIDNVVVAGEISHDALVDASGEAITLTAAQIATYSQSGFYIKEV
jgi:uncharacterized protein RhaS with RHS repeats